MPDADATPETAETAETAESPKTREGPGRMITMQEIYAMGGLSPEEAQQRTEEHETQARVARVNAVIEELIDALNIRDSPEGVVLVIGGDGKLPSPEELEELLTDGEGIPLDDDEVDDSESCPGCGGGTVSRCRCGEGHRQCEKGHDWVGCEKHGPNLAHVPDDGSHPSCGECAVAKDEVEVEETPGGTLRADSPAVREALANQIVRSAFAKVGTAAGASRGWDTKNQFQPPKPATEEIETPGEDRPPDTVPEIDTAMKSLALSIVSTALDRELLKHSKGYKLQMSEEELSSRAKKAWASRKKGTKEDGAAGKPAKAPDEEKKPKSPKAEESAEPKGKKIGTDWTPPQSEPEAEVPADPGTLSLDDFKKVGGQLGSNPGGTYEHPETGEKYYVKTPKTDEHARNEALAASLYQLAGVEVPEVQLVDVNGKQGVASKMVDGLSGGSKQTDWAGTEGAHEGFAVDAWLANWDVVGLEFDNMLIGDDGRAVRLDTGGALEFRAMGSPKGANFGDTVGELESLRDANLNSKAAAVFGNISDEALEAGVSRVLAVTDEQIDSAVNQFSPANGGVLATKLKARRDHMGSLYPHLTGSPATEASTSEPEQPGADEEAVAQAVMELTPQEQISEATETLSGFHQDVYTPAGEVAEHLAQAKPINGRVVATQEELEEAQSSYNGWSEKDNMRASKAKSSMKWSESEPLKATRLMADKITNPEKAFGRGSAYRAYGMPESAKLLFHRGALLLAAKKVAKSTEDSGSALAGLLYPAWARPGSNIAARYDDRPVAG